MAGLSSLTAASTSPCAIKVETTLGSALEAWAAVAGMVVGLGATVGVEVGEAVSVAVGDAVMVGLGEAVTVAVGEAVMVALGATVVGMTVGLGAAVVGAVVEVGTTVVGIVVAVGRGVGLTIVALGTAAICAEVGVMGSGVAVVPTVGDRPAKSAKPAMTTTAMSTRPPINMGDRLGRDTGSDAWTVVGASSSCPESVEVGCEIAVGLVDAGWLARVAGASPMACSKALAKASHDG